MPTKDDLLQKHGSYTAELNQEHEQLIEKILEDEELMIGTHRKHIDEAVDFAQKEMTLLNDVEKPNSDIQQYALSLDKLLMRKIGEI